MSSSDPLKAWRGTCRLHGDWSSYTTFVCPRCFAVALREMGAHATSPQVPNDPRAYKQKCPPGDAERKALPVATGALDYFPRALLEVARVSKVGNDQHNPGQPLHWDRAKSTDHANTAIRHFLDRGHIDKDGMRHTAKLAWRVLAMLETELEQEG